MRVSRVDRRACALVAVAALLAVSACGPTKRVALKTVANVLTGETSGAVTSHNDPETVRGALDFALITNESLLTSLPRHEPLLTATCGMYTQYAAGFLQPEAEALQFDEFEKSQAVQARAFRLSARGRDYCWRALEVKFKGIGESLKADPVLALRKARREHVPLLYWSAASLGTAISTGGLEHPDLVIDWPIVRALTERALELDESWSRGALHEIMISLESQDAAMGGSEERARKHFARAVALQQGLAPGPYISLAMGVSKAKQDRAEFEKLLKQALAIDPEKDPTNRLVTIMGLTRARVLLDHIDDLIVK